MRLQLTADERDRITRFRAAFNSAEQLIRKRFGGSQKRLSDLVDSLAGSHAEWKCRDSLKALAALRNNLAHSEGTDALRAVPTEQAISELQRVRKSVEWLDAVGKRFRRNVECVDVNDRLSDVLTMVRRRDYSQFPVVDDGRLLGLITENGITRWFAEHFETPEALEDLERVPVKDLLKRDEHKRAYEVIAVGTTVEAAVEKMCMDPALEALLISNKKLPKISLEGIVTRWDVLQLVGERR